MAAAIDVARQFVRLAWNNEEPEGLTHMRLQKLLYYAQGWHLAAFGRPLYVGRIEAWKHGPVVKEIYPTFKDYGAKSISPNEAGEPTLSDQDMAFILSVWEEYKPYSAAGLRAKTHLEAPWLEARGGLSEDVKGDCEISPAAMQSYFAELMTDRLIPGLTVEESYNAVEAVKRGPRYSHREAFDRIRENRV